MFGIVQNSLERLYGESVIFGWGRIWTFRPGFRFEQRYDVDRHGELTLKQLRLSVLINKKYMSVLKNKYMLFTGLEVRMWIYFPRSQKRSRTMSRIVYFTIIFFDDNTLKMLCLHRNMNSFYDKQFHGFDKFELNSRLKAFKPSVSRYFLNIFASEWVLLSNIRIEKYNFRIHVCFQNTNLWRRLTL